MHLIIDVRRLEHSADIKSREGPSIERATQSDYIHNRMSKQVTNSVT